MSEKPIEKGKERLNEEQPLPPTQIALLLILSESPAHASQIEKVLDMRGFEEWVDMKKSTIYKSLSRLEKLGHIKGKREIKEKISIKTYQIEEKGLKKLHEQIQLCVSNPPRSKSMFDLGLAGLSILTKSEALSALGKYKTNLGYGIQWFESILRQFDPQVLNEIVKSDPDREIVGGATAKEFQKSRHSFIVKALFERPYHIVMAQSKWLEGFIQLIEDDKGEFAFREE